MSLFVALRPPRGVRDRLAEAVRAARPTGRGLRWTRPGEWHLTLVFLGATGVRFPDLAVALERALDGRPALDLALDGWGTFPRHTEYGPRRASVLWAGAEGDGLHELAAALAGAASDAGVHVPSRPFVPHVTLARARPPSDVTDTLRVLGSVPVTDWRAERVHLMESGSPGPDRYRTVRSWGLPWGSESQQAPERGTS